MILDVEENVLRLTRPASSKCQQVWRAKALSNVRAVKHLYCHVVAIRLPELLLDLSNPFQQLEAWGNYKPKINENHIEMAADDKSREFLPEICINLTREIR